MYIESSEKVDLMDGTYSGMMSGYTVEIQISPQLASYLPATYLVGQKYSFKTEIGVKGSNVPVKVRVENGKATIITHK